MDFVDVIIREFRKKQKKNPRFSLRSFARKLEVEPSILSKIMSRKRVLSLNMARKISRGLDLSAEDMALLPGEILEEEQFIAEHQFGNVLSPLIALYFKIYSHHTTSDAAIFFDLPESDVNSCADYLVQRGFLMREGSNLTTGEKDLIFDMKEIFQETRNFYSEFYLNRWRKALEDNQKVHNLTLLIPFDKKSMNLLEKEFMKVATRLNAIFSDFEPAKELYAVTLGAFPLGKPTGTKNGVGAARTSTRD